jgi:hypothetical protein
MYKVIINLNDPNTRLEATAKPFAIFKSFTLVSLSQTPPILCIQYLFTKFKEINTSEIESDGDVLIFDSLQEAFNHGEKNNLRFY